MTAITKLSIIMGLLMIFLGIGLYLGSGKASVTALIPAFIGFPILVCGILARDEKKRKAVAHIAVLFAVLGALAGFGRGIPQLIKGETGLATLGTMVMALLCLFYVIACVRSFIAARKS